METIADFQCGCAERPSWVEETQKLYFTDVDAPAIYCYDARTRRAEQVYRGKDVVGGMTVHEDGRLLLFMAGGAIRLWSRDHIETVRAGVEGEEQSRFNDVLADPKGRVFCGTMPAGDRGQGRLYRWDPDGSVHLLLEQAGLPNGMGFSPDLKWFYFTNTQARTIERFSYSLESGEISNPSVLVQLDEDEGNPDGLAVDDEGCLWSAHFGGHRLARYSAGGEKISHIDLPMAENPTCPVFAGEGSSTLYLTTAGGGHRPEAGTAAGAVLQTRVSARGGAVYRSRWTGQAQKS
jgi:D-xylonolactonase